ncbi:MAG: hypothetical protein V3T30_06055, partial [Thermodesulfobacteriota bacterium]
MHSPLTPQTDRTDHSKPSRLKIFILLSVLLLAVASTTYADETSWQFDTRPPGGTEGWRQIDPSPLGVEGGALIIESANSPRIVSPPKLGVPFSSNLIRLRLKSSGAGTGVLIIRQTGVKEVLTKEFAFSESEGFKEYKIFIGDITKKERAIDRFAIEFKGEGLSIEIDSIAITEASAVNKAANLATLFWKTEARNIGTINYIDPPRVGSLTIVPALYILIIIVFVAAFIIQTARDKTKPKKDIALRSLAISFFIAALLFSIRMDYSWIKFWTTDAAALSGRSTEERVSAIYQGGFDDFFDFVKEIKATVPEGATVRPAFSKLDNYYA